MLEAGRRRGPRGLASVPLSLQLLLGEPPSQAVMEGPMGPEPCPKETAAGQLPPSLPWLGNTDPR